MLYVGSLNQGKGQAYLTQAMTGLEDLASLTVIGSRTSAASCPELDLFLPPNATGPGSVMIWC